MALNPAFADASINPSQSMGNDASVNPTQGALPTANQPQYTSPLNQPSPRWSPNGVAEQQNGMDIFGFNSSGKYVGANMQEAGYNPFGNYFGDPSTQVTGAEPWNPNNYSGPSEPTPPNITDFNYDYYKSPQYQNYKNNPSTVSSMDHMLLPFGGYGGSTEANLQNQSYQDFLKNPSMGQPSQNSAQGMAFTEFPDGTPNPIGNYYNAGVEGWQNQPGAPTFEQWQANPSLATEFQNRQEQQPNPALQAPTEFEGQLPNLPPQQDPPSRYTYFGNDKTDYSQLGLSQTALDHLKMMSGAQDAGQFYYDTQTKTFNQGAGWGQNPRPGQRVYTGMSNIPLDVMNKLGSGEEIDFSPYRQYTEGMPLPPTLQDLASQTPMPERQPGPTPPLAPTQPTPTATPTGTTPMATNPLSQVPVDPAAAYTPAPNVGTASSGGGSFTQGAPLPNITTTQQQVTAAPAFYTDYLNQLAKQGASTAQNAQYVGATDLQNQAFNQTAQNVGNYQPTLQSAINMAQNVGDSNLYKAVGELGQANIARNLAPQATAGIVGSGQFGSKRGAAALGDTIANAQLGITAQQAQALQQDMQNRIAAAQQLGNLASTTQQLGLGDINALATMGGQKQTIAQNEQLFPMQQLTNQSQLLRGYTIPTSTGSSYTGPIPGAYAASPLQQIAGLGALGAGISNTPLGSALFGTSPTIDPKTGLVINAGTSGIIGKGVDALTGGAKDLWSYLNPTGPADLNGNTSAPAVVPIGSLPTDYNTYNPDEYSTGA